MTANDYLRFIVDEIHSTVVATVDSDGLPVTYVIDMMYADENGLYFLTAKGKNFYQRLKDKGYLALSGKKGEDTMNCTAISVRGKVREFRKSHNIQVIFNVFKEDDHEIYKRLLGRN